MLDLHGELGNAGVPFGPAGTASARVKPPVMPRADQLSVFQPSPPEWTALVRAAVRQRIPGAVQPHDNELAALNDVLTALAVSQGVGRANRHEARRPTQGPTFPARRGMLTSSVYER